MIRCCRTCGQPSTHANGAEKQWDALAARLQALLPEGCEGRVVEATDWNEPDTWRHGLYYWFLVLVIRPVQHVLLVEGRLSAMGLDLLGGDENKDEQGSYFIYDVDPGRTVAWMRRCLKRAEAKVQR